MDVFKLNSNNITNSLWGIGTDFKYKKVTNDEIVKKGYLSNELVYSVTSSLAKSCATLPITLMNGDNPANDTDPIYKFFYDDWNKKMGKIESLEALYLNLFLHGKAYIWETSEFASLIPTEQWVLPSQQVTTRDNNNSYFDETPYYYFMDNGVTVKIPKDEMIVFKYYNPDILSTEEGLSPLQSVWNTVEASNNRAIAEGAMLKNRGISGFISPKATSGNAGAIGFSNGVIELVRKAFSGLTGGAEKFNKVEVIEQAADFTQLGLDANDLKIIEMQLPQLRSICRALNVPSMLFGDYESNTFANYKEARKSMYTEAIIPQSKMFINQYEKKLLNKINNLTGQRYWLKIAIEEIEALNKTPLDLFKELPNNISAALLTDLTPEERKQLILTLGLNGKG